MLKDKIYMDIDSINLVDIKNFFRKIINVIQIF